MRRLLRILGKILSTTLLSLIVILLVAVALLQIPAFQNFVVDWAASAISEKLGTRVSIGRVNLSFTGKVGVEKFYVEDFQRDTLLYVGKLDAYITGLGIFGGGIVLDRGEITDSRLCLHETPGGEMNIKQVVARLSDPNKPKKGNFKLKLRRASVDNMDFCLEKLEHRNPEFGIDFSHLHLIGIDAAVDDLTIDGSAIYTTIDALSARERSGFELNHLAGRFYLTSGCIGFENTSIITPRSNVTIPYVSLVGNSWEEYKDFIGAVELNAAIRNSTLSTDDIAYFSPKLRDWDVRLSNINIEATGTVDDFKTTVASLQIGDATHLTAEASVKGLPDIKKTHFDLNITNLSSTAGDVDKLAAGIARADLPDKLVGMLGNTGRIDLSARFRGMLSSFDVQLGVSSAVGSVACNLLMTPLKGGRQSVKGDVATRGLRLGELLDKRELFGKITLTAYVDGVVGKDYTDANIVGNVSQFGFNDYVYDSLRLDGRIRNKEFDGRITARDPNLDFDFFGVVDLNDSVPRYDFSMDLRRADLVKLRVNHRDSVSVLSGRVVAEGSGRTFDDMNGSIRVTDALYKYNDQEVVTKQMLLTGANSARSKSVELRSDFADVTFRSKTSYHRVFEYLKRSAWKYLPVITRGKIEQAQAVDTTAVADDYSLLSVLIRRINPVVDAITPGLQIADSSSMQLMFNPANNRLSFKASSDYIERRKMLATRLNVTASNRGDSLAVYASAEDLYAGSVHLPRLSLTGGAKQGKMQLSAGFDDTLRRTSGLVGVRAEVLRENGPAGREVELHILPSHLTRGNTTWQIFAHRILLDTTRVVIDKFYVMNQGQELLLNGVASRSERDSVTLRLRNFDLAPFSQFADRMGYEVEGRTNGDASMRSVLRGGEMQADIWVDSLAVNGIAGPPLRLTSRWDVARNRAGLAVVNRVKRDTLIRGFFAPDRMRYYARLNVDSLDMGLLDPVLSGVISETRGLASAELVLQGEGREADLEGSIRVAGLSTKVDFTQVTYTMPEAVLDVKNNRFRASNVAVFDPDGNRGRFDIDLNLQHLSNIGYDVRVAPQQMLVLNTTEKDNDVFYGKVYASGTARIKGDKGLVNMDIAAMTDDNSTFFLPLSSRANISYADFVTFVEPRAADSTDYIALKKQMFERRRKQKDAASNVMNISLLLDVRPNAELEMNVAGNTIRARGEGTLNLQISPRQNVFEMYGDYSLTEGSFLLSLQNILNRKFVIEPGSTIQWTGSPMDAMLDIDAVYKVKASLQPLLQGTGDQLAADRSVPVECLIHLGDRLSRPAITFDVKVPTLDPETQTLIANALSTPETIDLQFAYLLLFKSFMAENNAAASNIGAAVSYNTGLEFLTNQLSNALSIDGYNVVIRYRPKSELTSDEVDFGLSKSLINNRLFVEVEGNYLIDNKQAATNSAMSNFMGEAYITYLIDRSGSLKLKAFTQTIDRFDENQGLQETGIGIYYKEDFNNFRDLRQRVKDRFTNKKRKARRIEKAAARAAEKAADTLRQLKSVDKKEEE